MELKQDTKNKVSTRHFDLFWFENFVLALYPLYKGLVYFDKWVGTGRLVPVLKLTHLNLKPQRGKPNPLSCPEGEQDLDTWWYKKHKRCTLFSKIVNSLPQWHPGKDYGTPTYTEPGRDVIEKKRSCTGTEACVYIHTLEWKDPRQANAKGQKVFLFCVLDNRNTCRELKDSGQATQNLPNNDF